METITLHCPHGQSDALVRNGRASQPKGWSPLVARHRSFLPLRPLLHRFLGCDQAVVPEEQHAAGGSETGQTAHVEHWNTTVRQRLVRFVRKTLSFSKSTRLHEACLLLFLHHYNLDRAIILM